MQPSLREDQNGLGRTHLQYSLRRQSQARLFTATLLQVRVLRFGFFQDGNIRVGVFPKGIFAAQERPDKGGVGIRPLRGLRLQGSGTNYFQTRQVCDEGLPSLPA